ncbi:single-stranded DNA-binding protein [uncultured Actinomyces sp.]|uniref:single-stranded DNA-binding protein n=1 Tax=uncultured Actinomyces sp. TaxID=249061 RepID=UPI002621A192|nr:single-stranded DNA-binding protein [uncultured Actinomyces sp.]
MAFTGTLTGNLGQDPQMRYTDSGKALLQLSIAATPRGKRPNSDQWEDVGAPVWLGVTFWEQDAERVANLQLQKGDQVAVSGTLKIREYTRRDGQTAYSLELHRPRFLGAVPRNPQPAQGQGQGAHGENIQWDVNNQANPWETQETAPF